MGWKEKKAEKKRLLSQRARLVTELDKEVPGSERYEKLLGQIKTIDDLIKGGKMSRADGWRIALSAIGIVGLPLLENRGILFKTQTDRQAIGLLKDILPKPGRKDLDADQVGKSQQFQNNRPPKR